MIHPQEPKHFFLALGSVSKLTVKSHPTVSYSANSPLGGLEGSTGMWGGDGIMMTWSIVSN